MKRKKWVLLQGLILLLTVCMAMTGTAYGVTSDPALTGQAAILMDGTSGQVLYEKESHVQKFPASTTKIMTAILAIENLKMDDVITVDAETPYTAGSRMYLVEGEQLTVQQVLYGMMTESANDAAVALAKKISGSVEEFAKLMNEKMREVGGTDTHFVNPNGLENAQHITTVYDMAMLANYAMKNPRFRDVVKTYRYVIPASNKQEIRYMYNTNRLLYDTRTKVQVNGAMRPCKYEGVTGIKTGYTSQAGGTLVASAKRGDTELIAVVMQSTDKGRFADCITLLDWGFENYKTVPTMDGGQVVGQVKVKRGQTNRVDAVMKDEGAVTVKRQGNNNRVTTKIVLDEEVTAPVKKGANVGKVQIYDGKELKKEVDAIAAVAVPKGGLLSVFGINDTAKNRVLTGIGLTVVLLGSGLSTYVVLKRRQVRRRKQRRKERQERIRQKEEGRLNTWEKARNQQDFRNEWPNYKARGK